MRESLCYIFLFKDVRYVVNVCCGFTPESEVRAQTQRFNIKKKVENKPNHPPTAQMVIAAIKEKKGSSLIAIKKYISENYQIDADKMNFFIKKSLKAAVADGVLEGKATNMTGSFRLTRREKYRSEKEDGAVAHSKPKPKPVKADDLIST